MSDKDKKLRAGKKIKETIKSRNDMNEIELTEEELKKVYSEDKWRGKLDTTSYFP